MHSAPLDDRKPVRILALAAGMQAIGGGLGWSLVPPLMPELAKELGITHAMGGLVWGSAPLGIALASLFGGSAADRFGARRTAGLAMLVGALACALRAAVIGPWTLALAMLFFGAHIGFVMPCLPKALAAHISPARLGRANGFTVLAYTLTTALIVIKARTLLEPMFGGWRPLTLAAAAMMALIGLLWLLFATDRGASTRHAGLTSALALIGNGQLRRVAAMQFLLFGGYLALLGLLPRGLAEAGVALPQIGVTVAAWLVTAAIANYAGPALSDRLGLRRPLFLYGALLAGTALLALAFAPASARLPLLVVAAIGGGSFAPLLLMMPLELPGIGPARAGAGIGLLLLLGQLGGFLLPLASGAMAQSQGFPAAIALLAIAHLAIVLPAWGLRETGSRAGEPAALDADAADAPALAAEVAP